MSGFYEGQDVISAADKDALCPTGHIAGLRSGNKARVIFEDWTVRDVDLDDLSPLSERERAVLVKPQPKRIEGVNYFNGWDV